MLKPLHQIIFLSVILFLFHSQPLKAQTFTDIGFYWEYVGKQHRQITEDFLSYTSAVAHGKSARKVENRRKDLLQTMKESQKNIRSMPPFEGDKSLRDSVTSFLKLSFLILNEDYGKIVNLEEVAEQSYDAMEAYILAQELANNKLKEAGASLEITERKFAAAHHLNLIEGKGDEVSKKMEKAGKVSNYYHKVYLIFFKSYKQEMYLLDAIEKKNINAIEQNRSTLLKYATEGLLKLDTIKPFNGDNSLVSTSRQLLGFYVGESKDKIAALTNYFMKEDDFQKIKKAMDAKGSSRTQEDIDQYNKAVNDMNKASNDFNNINKQLNISRSKSVENWNNASQGFLDKHTPHHK